MHKVKFAMDRVTFDNAGSKFVNVIKLIRTLTGQGLKESKDCCDNLRESGKAEIDSFNMVNLNDPEHAECISELSKHGVFVDVDKRIAAHVRTLREMACALILEGNEHLARDIMTVTEKWGQFVGKDA